MIGVVLLSLLALCCGSPVEKRSLQSLDSLTLQTFTQIFRQTLLDRVAVEWNATIDMSNKLSADMNVCKQEVETKVNKCKSQAQSVCQANPTFTDYLNFVNPYTYLQGPLNDLASKFTDIKNVLGDGAGKFFSSLNGLANSVSGSFSGQMNDLASKFGGIKDVLGDNADQFFSSLNDLANSVFGGFSSAFTSVKNGITDLGNKFADLGNQISGGVGDLGNKLSGGLTDAGHAVEHVGSSIGHAIGSVFGKREIDADTRKCMEKCDQCTPLLLPTQAQMIASVCGQGLIDRNNTINARAHKLQHIVDASTDKAHPIVTKVEFDPASMNGQMQIMTVYITAELNGQLQRYKTSVPYSMMNMPSTAQKMATEYWGKAN